MSLLPLVLNRTLKFPTLTGEGAAFDYTISTTHTKALFSRPCPSGDVLFVFRMDNIAQEENETLTLQLRPLTTLPTGKNVFFKSTIRLTIIDMDGKRSVCLVRVLSNMSRLFSNRGGDILH